MPGKKINESPGRRSTEAGGSKTGIYGRNGHPDQQWTRKSDVSAIAKCRSVFARLRSRYLPITIMTESTDLVMAGNFLDVLPEIGRYDASYGVVLHNQGKAAGGTIKYESVNPAVSGFFVRGQVRHMAQLTQGQIILAKNNALAQVFSMKESRRGRPAVRTREVRSHAGCRFLFILGNSLLLTPDY